MEELQRRTRRARVVLVLANLLFFGGFISLVLWLVSQALSGAQTERRMVLAVFTLLPVAYAVVFLFFSTFSRARRITRRAKRKAAADLASLPADAPPHRKARSIAALLPLRTGVMYGTFRLSLAPGDDPGWARLSEANAEASIATGERFDVVLLVDSVPYNFFSGEIEGLCSWTAAPRGLVESMDRQELLAAMVHELYHREAGEFKVRNLAASAQSFGGFATAFLIFYVMMSIILMSIPITGSMSFLPVFTILLACLWAVFKLWCWWGVYRLMPEATCVYADRQAARVVSDPVLVASAIQRALAYSAANSAERRLWGPGTYHISRFMFVPIRKSFGARGKLVDRMEALRLPVDGVVAPGPGVEAMNHRIEALTSQAAARYREVVRSRTFSERYGQAVAYLFIIVMMTVPMAISTGSNFLPVRLYKDRYEGKPNVVAQQPSEGGSTVYISPDYTGSEGGFVVTPREALGWVGRTVTWSNGTDHEQALSIDGIDTPVYLPPGASFSLLIGRSGRVPFRLVGGFSAEDDPSGEVYCYYPVNR
ncbi:MAG: hypothetical protein V1748_10130 [Actinomycetota bacterium]